ncbi:helix-turn-helix transcriptional regulator [Microbacterium sp. KR10-403]|uniref:ArsR/SmtB family transcription factor n=1 Tax=Microbacterium sp. KR10-403 TaxID=3158581 RepID=UPI0032E43D44
MSGTPRLPLDELGRVVGEPARLRILQELLGGPALPAGALAARLDLAPSTVSAHLTRLHDAGLVDIEPDGRRRLVRIADPAVAAAIEALLQLSDEARVSSLSGFHRRALMREARSCYDHLAGRVGVAVTDIARERGWFVERDGGWALPHDEDVDEISDALGLRLSWTRSPRPAVRPCSDWTERVPHLAGRLGKSLLDGMLDDDWLRRRRDDRALVVTERGRERLEALGVSGF